MIHTPPYASLVSPRLALIALLGACAYTQAETWVITDQAHPVTNTAGARVILLDDQQRLEEHLTGQLPLDLTRAAPTLQTYLSSPEGMNFKRELTQAQQGVADAWSLGIEKIPAIVIDRRYVVYGESDVNHAVELIERSRGVQR